MPTSQMNTTIAPANRKDDQLRSSESDSNGRKDPAGIQGSDSKGLVAHPTSKSAPILKIRF